MNALDPSLLAVVTHCDLHGRASADDLLGYYPQMAIPHFQRGLVWDSGAVGSLLESLFFGTPCGSIILWAPSNAAEHGVGLGDTPAALLIVDGQQRIRSLHSVFSGQDADDSDTEETSEDQEAEHDSNTVWCLNLGRLPEFQDTFSGGRRFALFRQARDPRTYPANKAPAGAPQNDAEALLPLNWFLENDDHAIGDALSVASNRAIEDAARAVLNNNGVKAQLRAVRKQPVFSVTTLEGAQTYRTVIAVYNRINSSGRRVEAEEKAYANLVAYCDGAEAELKNFFDLLATQRKEVVVHGLRRDGLMQRKKENRFGFKLFMRAFVMSLTYHSCRSPGGGSLSFDSADPDALSAAQKHLAQMLKATSVLLAHVESVLREELFCDDLRLLPETASLWPVFQLLIRFPELMQVGRSSLASCILRLMIANLEKRQLLTLCRRVNEALDAQAALDTLQVFQAPSDVESEIRKGVSKAQALNDRFVLMLYWLLRQRGAVDFSYDANLSAVNAARLRTRYGTAAEPRLTEALAAERQHLVPYRRLKKIFDLSGARPGRHEVNDIGNLTYISAGENGFDTGVGDTALKLRNEPPKNLAAHFLSESELISVFEDVCGLKEDANVKQRRAAGELYTHLCASRKTRIAHALIDWDAALRSHAEAERSATADLLPAVHLIKAAPEDSVRDYDAELRKRLVRLMRAGGRLDIRNGHAAITFTPAGRQKRQVVRIDLVREGIAIALKLANHGFADAFVARFPNVETNIKKNSKRCRIATEDQNGVEEAEEILEWIGQQIQPVSDDTASD